VANQLSAAMLIGRGYPVHRNASGLNTSRFCAADGSALISSNINLNPGTSVLALKKGIQNGTVQS